jgi:hypothetical protein
VNGFTNGAYVVNLKLKYHIPEFLPMWGKKARIYYHGIPSFCVGCYTVGHVKADCNENSISWKDYINILLDTGIDKKLFGSWFRSNINLTRESHATFEQPNFKKRKNSTDNEEDLTLETLSPRLIELFKKFQSSTPNSSRRSPSRGQGSNSRSNSASNYKPKNDNRNRGRGSRCHGRGGNNSNSDRGSNNDSSDKSRNRGRGRG